MKNKHEGMIKGFTQLSRAYYGKNELIYAEYKDEIMFGFYAPEGGSTGEIAVKWIDLDNKLVPKITIFSDGWSALSHFHDLIDLLGQHDNEDSTPEDFCQFLLKCGFIDKTETINPLELVITSTFNPLECDKINHLAEIDSKTVITHTISDFLTKPNNLK